MRIPQAIIDATRRASDDAMPDTGTIYRRTLTADGNGGKATSYAASETVSYRLTMARNGMDRAEGQQIAADQEWHLTVAYDTDIRETDRFEDANGNTYEVVTTTDLGSYAIRKRVVVKKL